MDSSHYTLEFEKPLRELEAQLESLKEASLKSQVEVSEEICAFEKKLELTKRSVYSNLTVWQRVQIARHPKRPTSLDYISFFFEDFEEIHGDRLYRDDPAFVGGPAFFKGRPVMVIGQQKGRDTKGNLRRNFGCPHPEGYRKALRMMKMAEKFRMPVISFIDTPGAFPGIGAEERHVAEAIAVNIREMSTLRTPIIAVVIGEGGSGGALGAAVADVLIVLENAYYSVISPEGCAAILWKDRSHAPAASEALALSCDKLLEFGIADEIVEEPFGGAHRDHPTTAANLLKAIEARLEPLLSLPVDALLENRYQKYRAIGRFEENIPTPPVPDSVSATTESSADLPEAPPSPEGSRLEVEPENR
ncbi:MAG: acetyl-CoA carboxylase carboxyltransferase subunit alpha [Puniceicoccaceae bacterium]